MSCGNFILKNSLNYYLKSSCPLLLTSRYGHTLRGKPPGVARTLEQRLQDENPIDPEVVEQINIGFPKLKRSRSIEMKERLAHLKSQRTSPQLEKTARRNDLTIDLDKVYNEYKNTTGQHDLRRIADHYNIFKDLFGDAYFVPRVALDIKYEASGDTFVPVYNGNIVKPLEAAKQPLVSFDGVSDPITGEKSSKDSYWTLIATNPDGHFTKSDSEYVHWFVSNIPNGDIAKGETLVEYMQPIPPKGIGFQRYIFVLYKQNSKLDFSGYKVNKSDDLELRTFKTLDFYKKYQDDITPAGLAFFQSDWDTGITDFYHNVLNLKEPIFEYEFPKPYLQDQKWFPLKQPFNLYMDKHRDIKQVNKEYLEKKLAKTHPFEGKEAPLKFPNAHPIRNVPSWLRTEIRKERLSLGRINDYK
ncbi:39S ribosomal protein L38, mitochondrial [Eupeodes corollae]|uniref:39S ribosomal protein L38, mitochondrial n=1 Tax=Eupeodes corollae TaxID=290404 RepID=UPI002493A71D|nr:39S ribosomal protein L38, mitochondrial [Eupeodes corollae]